jgi:hypothetical protein
MAIEVKDWSHEIDVIMWIVLVTFIAVLFVLAILLSRGGRTLETKKVLDAIDATRDRIDNVDLRIERDHRFQANWMLRLLARFGFLEAQDVANDIKKRFADKTDQSKKEFDP